MKVLAHVHVYGSASCRWIENREGTKLTRHVEHAAVFEESELIPAAVALAEALGLPVEIIAVPYEADIPSAIRELIRLD